MKKQILIKTKNGNTESYQLYSNLSSLYKSVEARERITHKNEIEISEERFYTFPFEKDLISVNKINFLNREIFTKGKIYTNFSVNGMENALLFEENKVRFSFKYYFELLKEIDKNKIKAIVLKTSFGGEEHYHELNKNELIIDKKIITNIFPQSQSEDINYSSIEKYYSDSFGKEWKEKINKMFKEEPNEFISVYLILDEKLIRAKYENKKIILMLTKEYFEKVYVSDLDIEVIYSFLEKNNGSIDTILFSEKEVNKIFLEEEIRSKKIETVDENSMNGKLAVQLVDNKTLRCYFEKISGVPFKFDLNYSILKTAGDDKRRFKLKSEQVIEFTEEVDEFKIPTQIFNKNGGTIKAYGEKNKNSKEGIIARYEIPKSLLEEEIVISVKFKKTSKDGEKGEDVVSIKEFDQGELRNVVIPAFVGGLGGRDVILTIKDSKGKIVEKIGYGGNGYGGEGAIDVENTSCSGKDGKDGKDEREALYDFYDKSESIGKVVVETYL